MNDLNGIKKFVEEYSLNKYGRKWMFGFSLSFKEEWKYREFKYLENWMDRLGVYCLGLSGVVMMDGLYVGEWNKENGGLGLHSVLLYEGDMSKSEFKNRLFSWGKNKGSVDIIDFKSDEGWDFYISKYLYKGFENNWNVIRDKV